MNENTTPTESRQLPAYAHAIAGWPLIMIVIGGALGGLCGGGAYGISMALLKKRGVSPLSCFLSFIIGVAGVGLYFVVVVALTVAFPDMFGEKRG